MDDDCFSDHLVDGKTVCQKQRQRGSMIPEQRRQVPGMVWMFTAVWIVMGHRVCERVVHSAAAVGPSVDMKPENPFPAKAVWLGQAAELSEDHNSGTGLVEPNSARYTGIVRTARNAGRRLGPAAEDGKKIRLGTAAK